MRIAFVSDSIYPYNKGGKEKRLFEISTRLATRGHDVHIYTMHWWDSAEKIRQENNLTLHAICKNYPLYAGDRRSIKQGIMFGLACLKIGSIKADAIDVDHMPFFPIFGAFAALTPRGRSFVGTWHEALTRKDWTDYMGVLGNVSALIERISVKLPYAIGVASPHTKELIASELGRTRRTHLVSSGVDKKYIESIKPSQQKIDILSIGRLVKDKNHKLLIDSVKLLAKENPKINCVIVGRGPEENNLQKQIKKLGLEKNITLVQFLPEASDVYAYMKSARVFALPSLREGFGIVAVESMCCGTPVVTTDSSANGAQSLINPGVNGEVASPDAAAYAAGISRVLSKKYDKKTIQKSDVILDWEDVVDAQMEVYAL